MSLASVFGGLLLFVIMLPVALAPGMPALPSNPLFWVLAAADAFCSFSVGILAVILAPRYARSAEVALVLLLENIFGPLWVYVGLGEVRAPPPPPLALLRQRPPRACRYRPRGRSAVAGCSSARSRPTNCGT